MRDSGRGDSIYAAEPPPAPRQVPGTGDAGICAAALVSEPEESWGYYRVLFHIKQLCGCQGLQFRALPGLFFSPI